MKLVTTLICAGLVLTMSPAKAQLPENWTTVEVLAVKWMTGTPGDPDDPEVLNRVTIQKDESYHDAAIVSDDEELEWVLTCMQCNTDTLQCKTCEENLEFAVLDLHWVADLHELTSKFIDQAKTRKWDDPFTNPVDPPGRGEKKRTFEGFDPYDPSQKGNGWGQKDEPKPKIKKKVTSAVSGASSELWKYTIAVEDPDPTGADCLEIKTNKEATLDPSCDCEGDRFCDIWDPHVYTHPGKDY